MPSASRVPLADRRQGRDRRGTGTEETPTFGERVAYHRKRRGLSQVELGRLIGWSESCVSQVERNTRKVDRMSVLELLAETLDMPVAELAPTAPIETVAEAPPWWAA